MKHLYKKKVVAGLLSLLFLLTTIMPAEMRAADRDIIYLSTKEEFLSFAKNCSLDSWSKGKTVLLNQDIDLTDSTFAGIPTFGGTFDGKGHTISGVEIKNNGSTQGLFRYIQEGATVKDVTVKGTVTPGGSKGTVGGIVGNNAGTIQNITFSGTIKGGDAVGGIAGINLEMGKIISCTVSGNILGEKMAGGIAGKNYGTIMRSSNKASINTSSNEAIDGPLEAVNNEVNTVIDQLTTEKVEDQDEALGRFTDIGGIAGYSSGIIEGCTNSAAVGYPHIGYNVGGIAGRQAGYLLGCSNTGVIYGRKDVGGIVGQMEPYIISNLSDDLLSQLQKELDKLRNLINGTLDDVDQTSTETTEHLSNLVGYSASAKDYTESLLNQTTDFIDGNIEELNHISAMVANALDQMVPVIEDMEVASKTMTEMLEEMQGVFETLEATSAAGSQAIHYGRVCVEALIEVNRELGDAMDDISRAIIRLRDAVIVENEAGVQAALQDLSTAILEFGVASDKGSAALGDLSERLDNMNGIEDLISNSPEIISALRSIAQALNQMGLGLKDMSQDALMIMGNVEISWSDVKSAMSLTAGAIDTLEKASYDIEEAFEALSVSFNHVETTSDLLGEAMGQLSEVTDTCGEMTERITSALSGIKQVVTNLSEEEPIEFVKLGDAYRMTSDQLYASLGDLSTEMEALNGTISSASQTLTQNMRAINEQFYKIMEIVIEVTQNLGNISDKLDLTQYLEDASDEDISQTKLGKVLDCYNEGSVEADHNVGGIVGLMAIEYGIDPEDDFEKPTGMNVTYQTKAVLQNCRNEGGILGKKDYIGGIVGRMNLGTTLGCESYGAVESSSGNYVGGIAGGATSVIRDNFAKCTVAGKNYIGGIAGTATKLRHNYAITEITSTGEYIGGIAGEGDTTKGKIIENYFMNAEVGAIDQISYARYAEPISFEVLAQVAGIPSRFISFEISYYIDGNKVGVVSIEYGKSLKGVEAPEIPEKKGYYSYWPEFNTEKMTQDITLEAVYKPWVSVLASVENKQDSALALGLVEGLFTEEATLSITEGTVEAPVKAKEDEILRLWHVKLEGTTLTDQSVVPIRLLNDGEGKATVWQYKEGAWQTVEVNKRGKYLELSMEGIEGEFCVLYQKNNVNWAISGIGVGIAACLLLTAFVAIKKYTTKKTIKINS